MLTSTYKAPSPSSFRLGAHHFAHIRALAEGLDLVSCAQRYLGIEHGNQAKTASQHAVNVLRAIASRRNEPAWRLIGLTLPVVTSTQQPSLQTFIESRQLEDWPEAEAASMYAEIYPHDAKAHKRQRLRERLLELLSRLEKHVAEQPHANDRVTGWLDNALAHKLITAGIITLGDLNIAIASRTHWYQALPGIGRAKAQRIETYLKQLLPTTLSIVTPVFRLPNNSAPITPSVGQELTHPSSPLLAAKSDAEAIQAWLQARANSVATQKTYAREARRLLLWLQHACMGATLASMQLENCNAYIAFLSNIPSFWMSRRHAAPGHTGWAPFRGPLSQDSQHQAIVIVSSLFAWLQSAHYLQANPWMLINKSQADSMHPQLLDSKALSPQASAEILNFIDQQTPSPAQARIRFIVIFMSTVGLRSAELLYAKLGHLKLEPEGWMLQVHGKGAKNRIVHLPGQALAALTVYLATRDITTLASAPHNLPLLANIKAPSQHLGYQALYEHVKNWLGKAVIHAALPAHEKSKLLHASTHWLRHTFGTRAVALDVPLDVIQAQLGHASIQTTMDIYGKAPLKRRADALSTAFG